MRRPVSIELPELFALDRLDTPIGTALLVTDEDGLLCALDWEDYEPRMRELLRLQHGAVSLKEKRAPTTIREALAAYFNGDLDSLRTIKWRIGGTPFQRKVWTALVKIPPGTTLSYGALAAQLGSPRAMRAVGHANGANPISVVIPCHRLIGADGSLVKYGGGLERKRWLLMHEGVTLTPQAVPPPRRSTAYATARCGSRTAGSAR
jgi:methylated-DNA-[protein]-cysteine S-methyltransferase